MYIEEINSRITGLLDKQHDDAANMDKESWKWGARGALVRGATRDCKQILMPLPTEDQLAAYFQRTLPLLSTLAARYRENENDADGFGLGAVREIEEGMLTLCRELKISIK